MPFSNYNRIYISLPSYVAAYLQYVFKTHDLGIITIPRYYPVPWQSIDSDLSEEDVVSMPTLDELLTDKLIYNVGLYESRHLYPLAFSAKAYESAISDNAVRGHIPSLSQIDSLVPFAIPEMVHTSKGWVSSSSGYVTMECKAGYRFQKACQCIFKNALKDYLHARNNSYENMSLTAEVRRFCRHHRFSVDTTEATVESIRQSIYRWKLKS